MLDDCTWQLYAEYRLFSEGFSNEVALLYGHPCAVVFKEQRSVCSSSVPLLSPVRVQNKGPEKHIPLAYVFVWGRNVKGQGHKGNSVGFHSVTVGFPHAWIFQSVVVSTSASDWLERLVSEMTYDVLTGTLNHTHSLTQFPKRAKAVVM